MALEELRSIPRPTISHYRSRAHVHMRGRKVITRVKSSRQAKPTRPPCLRARHRCYFAIEWKRHEAPAILPIRPCSTRRSCIPTTHFTSARYTAVEYEVADQIRPLRRRVNVESRLDATRTSANLLLLDDICDIS